VLKKKRSVKKKHSAKSVKKNTRQRVLFTECKKTLDKDFFILDKDRVLKKKTLGKENFKSKFKALN